MPEDAGGPIYQMVLLYAYGHPLFSNPKYKTTFQQAFSHAEVQAFLRMIDDAIQNGNGVIPKWIIIVVDRRLCPQCQWMLERLKLYFGVENITVLWRENPLLDSFGTTVL